MVAGHMAHVTNFSDWNTITPVVHFLNCCLRYQVLDPGDYLRQSSSHAGERCYE